MYIEVLCRFYTNNHKNLSGGAKVPEKDKCSYPKLKFLFKNEDV